MVGRPPERGVGRRHPWLENVAALPPAKAAQVQRIVNARLFWGDCRRTRTAELLHPLLSQPVLEHCLSIPADVLAKGAIMGALVAEGMGILLISSELPEIVGLSDRVLVMRGGRICGEFPGGAVSQDELLSCALGA